MSTALPGEHYCFLHQGNHSHYATHNCTVCKLTRELAEAQADQSAWQDAWVKSQAELTALKASRPNVEETMLLVEKYAIAWHERRTMFTAQTEHDCDAWSEAIRAKLEANEMIEKKSD